MDYKVTSNELTSIADAIRTKGGTSSQLTFPNGFITAVQNIPTGGGGTMQTKSKTYTPTETAQTETVTADSGYDGLSSVAVSVGAISSTYVGTGITRRSSSDLYQEGDGGDYEVYAPAGYYPSTAHTSVVVPSGTAGTPAATKGTVSNHSVSVTPSVTNSEGYIPGGTKSGTAVTVSASELVSGSETKTANGTYDVTNLAELVVDVQSGGGASNLVEGTFTTGSSAGYTNISIPYTGSGYPIMCVVVIDGGAYHSGTSWYTSTQRYAIGQWTMTKSNMTASPSYTTSGAQNQGVTTWVFKNSASSSTSYSRSSAMNTNVYTTSNASNSGANTIKLHSGNVLSYYVNTSSYGLHPNMTYRYFIVYSE